MSKVYLGLALVVTILGAAIYMATPKVVYTFEYPRAVVKLTTGKCKIDWITRPEAKGGSAVVDGQKEVKVCWLEQDGMIYFVDENGNQGSEPKK